MNIKQAKAIPIEKYLSQKGHLPKRQTSSQLWYCSPLRQETTASFKVNLDRNQWYDFGLGKGGDLLDLVKTLEGLRSVSDVLSSLSAIIAEPLPATMYKTKQPTSEPSHAIFEILSVSEVTSPSLRKYLQSRGLNLASLPERLREVHYKRGEKAYFGLGIANDAGGFEVRSSQFKGTLGPKAITTIAGTGCKALLFEGMIDYLTAVQDYAHPLPNCMLLNSVATVQQAIAKLRSLGVDYVEVFRDNDAAGLTMLKALQESLPGVAVIDMATIYQGYKDLNEEFMSRSPLATEPDRNVSHGR